MNRRCMLTLIALASASLGAPMTASIASAQSADEGVKAASKAFYAALAVIDDGAAMEKVWALTDYVTYVGPRSKTVIVGWKAQKQYWIDTNKIFVERNVSITDSRIHANGNLAWEVGHETGQNKMKDGSTPKNDYIVTNIYEKQGDGRWLIVSHHVQPKPQ